MADPQVLSPQDDAGEAAPPSSLRDRRRAEIVTEARQIIATDGLDALTFAALEARLSFTRGVITYHFRNKAEIVDAALLSAIEEIDRQASAAVLASGTLAEKLAAVLTQMLRGFLERPDAARVLISFWSRIPHDQHATDTNAGLYARWRAAAAGFVRAGQGVGRFRADADADAHGAMLVGMVLGLAMQHYFEPGAVDIEAALEESVTTFIARLLLPSDVGAR